VCGGIRGRWVWVEGVWDIGVEVGEECSLSRGYVARSIQIFVCYKGPGTHELWTNPKVGDWGAVSGTISPRRLVPSPVSAYSGLWVLSSNLAKRVSLTSRKKIRFET